MGVYINREMPESCSVCFVKDCAARAKNKYVMSSRGQKCPIDFVPPHGRLIDADALKDLYHYNTHDTDIDKAWTGNIRRSIDSAPTIIPEEEGE